VLEQGLYMIDADAAAVLNRATSQRRVKARGTTTGLDKTTARADLLSSSKIALCLRSAAPPNERGCICGK
jgi:hypothetical protein